MSLTNSKPLSIDRVAKAADVLGMERKTKDGTLQVRFRSRTWLFIRQDQDGGVWSEVRMGRFRYPYSIYYFAICLGLTAPFAFRAWDNFRWFKGGGEDFFRATIMFAFLAVLFELVYAPLNMHWSKKRLFERAQQQT